MRCVNMARRKLEDIFSKRSDALLAGSIVAYFQAQQVQFSQGPIGVDASLVAYFKHEWQEYVDEGKISLSDITKDLSLKNVKPRDVEALLGQMLETLVKEQYLDKVENAYTINGVYGIVR